MAFELNLSEDPYVKELIQEIDAELDLVRKHAIESDIKADFLTHYLDTHIKRKKRRLRDRKEEVSRRVRYVNQATKDLEMIRESFEALCQNPPNSNPSMKAKLEIPQGISNMYSTLLALLEEMESDKHAVEMELEEDQE